MSKEAQKALVLSADAREKLAAAVEALAACGFGPDGPPLETTFAEIEEFGHEVGRLLAREVDENLTSQHAAHFSERADCPQCGAACGSKSELPTRRVQTIDGEVPLREPAFHCPACRRDFFPSTPRAED